MKRMAMRMTPRMTIRMTGLMALLVALVLAAAAPLAAQRVDVDSAVSAMAAVDAQGREGEAGAAQEQPAPREDNITPHIVDARALDVPYWKPPFYREYELPRWKPVVIGGMAVDLSPTKHVVMLGVAALLSALLLLTAAASHRRHSRRTGAPRGFAAGIEALVLWLRNEVALPNLGPHGERYVPFVLTLFFFIAFANLLGLVPYGATATANISVTATLAAITFVVVEAAGVRAQGVGYLNTIFYWNRDLALPIRIPMLLIMTPVEIVGKLTKPFALAIRLFANMVAGHIVILALIGLVITGFGLVAAGPFLMAVAIVVLEVFISLLQAFIFALLAAVFIGQIRMAHH